VVFCSFWRFLFVVCKIFWIGCAADILVLCIRSVWDMNSEI